MERVLKKIKQIKNQCDKHIDCANCVFVGKNYGCKVKDVTYELCRRPSDWDIDKIEENFKE